MASSKGRIGLSLLLLIILFVDGPLANTTIASTTTTGAAETTFSMTSTMPATTLSTSSTSFSTSSPSSSTIDAFTSDPTITITTPKHPTNGSESTTPTNDDDQPPPPDDSSSSGGSSSSVASAPSFDLLSKQSLMYLGAIVLILVLAWIICMCVCGCGGGRAKVRPAASSYHGGPSYQAAAAAGSSRASASKAKTVKPPATRSIKKKPPLHPAATPVNFGLPSALKSGPLKGSSGIGGGQQRQSLSSPPLTRPPPMAPSRSNVLKSVWSDLYPGKNPSYLDRPPSSSPNISDHPSIIPKSLPPSKSPPSDSGRSDKRKKARKSAEADGDDKPKSKSKSRSSDKKRRRKLVAEATEDSLNASDGTISPGEQLTLQSNFTSFSKLERVKEFKGRGRDSAGGSGSGGKTDSRTINDSRGRRSNSR